MATLYLSAIDPERVAERASIAARMRAIPGASDMPGPNAHRMTDAEYAELDALSTQWVRMSDRIQDAPCELGCGRTHDAVWTVSRVVADVMGPWAVYRIAGGMHTLPGGGIPLTLDKLPRDAVRLDPAAAAAFWHSED